MLCSLSGLVPPYLGALGKRSQVDSGVATLVVSLVTDAGRVMALNSWVFRMALRARKSLSEEWAASRSAVRVMITLSKSSEVVEARV